LQVWARAIVGDLDNALKDCNQALQLRPRYGDAFDSRGFVNLKSQIVFRALMAGELFPRRVLAATVAGWLLAAVPFPQSYQILLLGTAVAASARAFEVILGTIGTVETAGRERRISD
jgi:hypothetical protein